MRRFSRRLRLLLPFLLICLAGGATALLQAAWLGLAMPPTGVLLLVVGNIFCVWGLWRWRRLMPLLPAPPWRRALQASVRRPAVMRRATARARWQLISLRMRQIIAPPLARPRPTRPPRRPALPRRAARKRSAYPPRRLPMPTLAIEFVAPGRQLRLPAGDQEIHRVTVALVHDALRQVLPAPPPILALHDEPRELICQLAMTTVLSGGQQRAVGEALQVHGFRTSWSDIALLNLRRESVVTALPRANLAHVEALWVPAVRTRQGQVWWPLPRGQHLVIAGNAHGPLGGCVQRLLAIPAAQRPPLLVHDAEGRLLELHDVLANLPVSADALAEARQAQLAGRFARERDRRTAPGAAPILVVLAPNEEIWPDLHPLLAADSGVQVVLVLGEQAPLSALRATCHRLPVIEVADPRFPPLPDAFRPANLPPARLGLALAWLPGGTIFWRGLPPTGDPSPPAEREVP